MFHRQIAIAVFAAICISSTLAQAAKPADIDFDDLKIEIEGSSRYSPSMLPDEIEQLDGQVVKIRGFMWPSFQQRGITAFVLLMNTECKFGSAKDPLWCNIRVKMDENETAAYSTRPMTIEGKLSIDLLQGEKYDISLYTMENARVVK